MKRENKVSSRLRAGYRRMAGFFGLAAVLGGIVLLVPSLRADDGDADTGSAQPARAVRLSYVEGEVHLYQGSQQVGDQAVANTPLFEGARIDTGNDGRAEIQYEDGSVARISPQSSATLTVLKGLSANAERDAEIVLNSGLGYFELQGDSDSNHMKVRFGDTDLTASGFTVVRINMDKAPGEVAVFSGNAHMEGGPGPTLDLHGGESVALDATDPGNYALAETIEPDSWDTWNSDRDQAISSAAAGRTEADENLPDKNNPAWSDLDANGNWYNVPDQGYVWSPYDASNPNWDPYGSGYWMDNPGYGYMWISGYPWGYLPYQCGAWNFYSSFGWGWAPGGCNPWWGGNGGWVINIGYYPPRYHYPVRPRQHYPRRMDGDHLAKTHPVIAVHHQVPATLNNAILARRDKSTTVTIAGNPVTPLRPVGPRRLPYDHPVPMAGGRLTPNTPGLTGYPRPVLQVPNSTPRAIVTPARPGMSGSIYTPAPQPRTVPTYRPAPAPSRPMPPPAPPSHVSAPSAPPAHVNAGSVNSGGGGGGHPGGGPHR